MPSAFISYSHESEPHRMQVLDLARALLQVGWEVRLDRFTGYPNGGWPRWMADQIEAADRILCICTPTYRARFDGDQAKGGLGVSWEGYLLTGLHYRARHRRRDVIPVWPAGKTDREGPEYLPLVLRPLAGMPFDIDAIVKHLGETGPARPEPISYPVGRAEAPDVARHMDPTLLLGTLFRFIQPRSGGQGPHDVPPSTFLRPEFAIVPFYGRESELEDLGLWCRGEGVRMRLLHGAGGAGKTRLALELAARLAREGWRTGPLIRGELTEEKVRALVQDPIPLLVIIDYAETRLEEVSQLLRHHELRGTSTMRVLLLARHDGDWVQSLLEQHPGFRDLWDNPLAVSGELPIGGQSAVKAFSYYFKLHLSEANLKAHSDAPPSVQDTPLASHIAALLLVRGLEGRTVEDLVDHEKRYLKRIADECGIERPVAQCLPKAMALITLAQGISISEADGWLARVEGLGDLRQAELRMVKNLLFDLYPGTALGISPVIPDRVGEAYIAKVDRDGRLAQAAVDGGRAVQALTVLTRYAQRGSREESEKPLRRLLEGKFANLAEAIISVAIQTGDPVGRVAADRLDKHPDVLWAKQVYPLLPQQTTALLELAVTVVRTRLAEAHTDEDRALLLNDLGVRCSAQGHREEALNATREAARIYRQLAIKQPEAFQPNLAMSLDNLGSHLSALGFHEEAMGVTQEAVEILRRAAVARPDSFLRDLATSLNNLGNRRSNLGLRQEALEATREAVEIYHQLARMRPADFLPDLAMGLNNKGKMLFNLSHHEEAIKSIRGATRIYRQLAQARPDGFLPNLARSLSSLGLQLSVLGQHEDALTEGREAAEIFRRLAVARPAAFLSELAMSLQNLGIQLSGLGRNGEALKATQEAVEINRRLVHAKSDAFLPYLAECLTNLGVFLSNLGRTEEALEATREVVEIQRRLAVARPDAFLPNLAKTLGSRGMALVANGHWPEAVAAFAEGLGIALGLTRKLPSAHRGLAAALFHDYIQGGQVAGLNPDPRLISEARSLGI